MARLFKKAYLTNEKELEHSENGPWDFVGTIRRPGHFPGCYFRSFGAKKLLVPMWGLKRNPLYRHRPLYLNNRVGLFIIPLHRHRAIINAGLIYFLIALQGDRFCNRPTVRSTCTRPPDIITAELYFSRRPEGRSVLHSPNGATDLQRKKLVD